jgi:hypothetical protein
MRSVSWKLLAKWASRAPKQRESEVWEEQNLKEREWEYSTAQQLQS